MEGEERDDQRQGDGDQRDESGAHVQEEDEEYDDHKDAAFEERLADIVDGAAYEAFLTVDVGGHLYVGRERFRHVCQCGVKTLCQFPVGQDRVHLQKEMQARVLLQNRQPIREGTAV